MPRLVILDQDCVVLLPLMLFIPVVALGEAVGSATLIRSDIVNGIDRIFFGI